MKYPRNPKELPQTWSTDIMKEFMSDQELKVLLKRYREAQIKRYIRKNSERAEEILKKLEI